MIRSISRLWRGSTPHRLAKRGADPVVDLLWEHAGGALVVVDQQGRIDGVNEAARELLAGLPTGAVGRRDVGRHVPVLPLFAAEARDGLWAEILAATPGGPPRAPVRVALATGATVAVTVVPLASGGAGPTGVLLRLVDPCRERELEALLSQAQRPQRPDEFSGGIAHDFNNLLAAILGAAEAIATHGGLPAEVSEDAAQIRASAERGSQLVRRLLAVGREQAAQPRRVAVPAAVAGLSSMLRRLLGRAIRLELDVDQDAALQVARVDPVELDRVLVNLAVNARDAMPGGGELRIASRAVTLHQALAAGGDPVGGETVPPGHWIIIDVRDGGVGIAPETLPRVLEPFFTTRRGQGGNGLGLSTVHGIVRQCGGFLTIESTVGVGTRVRVWLPACDDVPEPPIPVVSTAPSPAPSQVDAPSQAGAPPQAGATGRTVLLVDDETPVRRLAERALTRQGWRVLAADSAEAALATLDAEPAGSTPLAAMVSDIVMPGLDGAALVERVRARAGQAGLPVVLVSGYSDRSLGAALGEQPPTVFLAKPYTLGELVARVAALAGPPAC